ncbi:hypothetical protein BKA69DRAFT_1037924 [Paraphysoderma sedebokerense]|nr:hypothetical protein BKA69DRAFT_1037924 [Paraphysoderma sedebokerense]
MAFNQQQQQANAFANSYFGGAIPQQHTQLPLPTPNQPLYPSSEAFQNPAAGLCQRKKLNFNISIPDPKQFISQDGDQNRFQNVYPTPQSSHSNSQSHYFDQPTKRRRLDSSSDDSGSESSVLPSPPRSAPVTPITPTPSGDYGFPLEESINEPQVILKLYGIQTTVVTPPVPQFSVASITPLPSPTYVPEPVVQERMLDPSDKLRQMFSEESKCIPSTETAQRTSHETLRSQMIQWLIQINRDPHLRFHPETVFLAVNYADRYLSSNRLSKSSHYFLLGMVSLSVAAKIVEEFNDPLMEDMLKFLGQWNYTISDIKRMERKLLASLEWSLYAITPAQLLYELLRQSTVQKQIQELFAPSQPSNITINTAANFLTSLQHRLPLSSNSEPSSWRTENWKGYEGISRTVVRILCTLSEDVLLKSLHDPRFRAYNPSVITLAALNLALELHANTLLAHHPDHFSHLRTTRLRIIFGPGHRQQTLAKCVAELRTFIR